jgi:hypothetical protein
MCMHGCFVMLNQICKCSNRHTAGLASSHREEEDTLIVEIHHKKDTYPKYCVRKLRGDIQNFENKNLLCNLSETIGAKILNWGILQFRKIFLKIKEGSFYIIYFSWQYQQL